jgi:hypothetical protein
MHANGQSSALLDQERDVLPEIPTLETNQRIARGVGPVRRRDNVAHHGGMRAGETFYLLVVVVEADRASPDFLFHTRVIVPESRQVAELAPGHFRFQRVAVVKVLAP